MGQCPMCVVVSCSQRFGKRGRAVPSAVAFGAALSVGAVRAGVRRARGISDDQRTLIHRTQSAGLFAFNPTLSPSLSKQRLDDRSICSYRYQAHVRTLHHNPTTMC